MTGLEIDRQRIPNRYRRALMRQNLQNALNNGCNPTKGDRPIKKRCNRDLIGRIEHRRAISPGGQSCTRKPEAGEPRLIGSRKIEPPQ